jgi:virginiamycin B lyase
MTQHSRRTGINRSVFLCCVASLATGLIVMASEPAARAVPQFTVYKIPTANSASAGGGIVRGPDGNIWFAEEGADKIGRITTSGTITEFEVPTKNGIGFISSGRRDELWFSEFAVGNIWHTTVSGALQKYSAVNDAIYGLAVSSDGNIWFGETGRNAIGRMTPDGHVTEFPLPGPGRHPTGLTPASDGNIWFVEDYGESGALARITTEGRITEYPRHLPHSNATPHPAYPSIGYVAVATDGSIWFTDPFRNQISRRSASGTITEHAIPTPKSGSLDIVAGRNGDVWFSETEGNKFGHVSVQGTMTEYKLPTPASFPEAISIDSDGNMWIGCDGTNSILKVSMPH